MRIAESSPNSFQKPDRCPRYRDLSPDLSCKIANMGFVCACLVVLIHCPHIENGVWINDFILLWVKSRLSIVAVPVFFMISGFMLGRRTCDHCWYRRAVISRVRSLVVPFFALNLLWFPVKGLIHFIGVKFFGADNSMEIMQFNWFNVLYHIGLIPWGGNAVGGLWYLRSLFYIVLISPFLAWFVKRGICISMALCSALLGIWCLQLAYPMAGTWLENPMRYTFCAKGVLFFSVGLALSYYAPKKMPKISCLVGVVMLVFALTWRYDIGCFQCVMDFIVIISSAIVVWGVVPSVRWPAIVVGNTFPRFVLHAILLYLLPIPLKVFHIYDGVLKSIGLIPVWVLTMILTIAIGEFAKHCFPTFAGVVFGGRGKSTKAVAARSHQ